MPRSIPSTPRRGKTSIALLLTAVCVVVVAGGAWGVLSGRLPLQSRAATKHITEKVRRGTLEVSITERGSLDSASNVTLMSTVEGTTTIISIVPEGTMAKKGDVLVELDSSKLRDLETQQRILVEQADAALKQAIENLAIQKTQNESDIAAANLALELAKLDLEKYKQGEFPQMKNELAGSISLAEETLKRAQEKFEFSQRLSKKGYITQSELEADRIAVSKAEIELKVAREKLKVLDEFTYKRTVAEQAANAIEFEREIERTKRKAAAALTQAEADLSARKLTAEVERSKLLKLQAQVAACTMIAPQDGAVVYSNMNNQGRGGGQEVIIQEGAQVRERQAIVNLPDFNKMQVNARIHESRIGLIRPQLPAVVRVDAQPGEEFHGVLETVSTVPTSGNWPNRDLKEYPTVVRLTDDVEKVQHLKPGLTAEVQIFVDRVPNALLVPVQGVVEHGGKHYAFVSEEQGVSRREVQIGRTNDIEIQILEEGSALREGESVVLNPRGALPKEIAELERDRPAAPPTTLPEGAPDPSKIPPAAPAGPTPSEASPAVASNGPPGGRDPAAFFARLDADGDGKVTLAEMPERMQGRFEALDANHDQVVDLEEFRAGAASFRPPGGGPPPGAIGGG